MLFTYVCRDVSNQGCRGVTTLTFEILDNSGEIGSVHRQKQVILRAEGYMMLVRKLEERLVKGSIYCKRRTAVSELESVM